MRVSRVPREDAQEHLLTFALEPLADEPPQHLAAVVAEGGSSVRVDKETVRTDLEVLHGGRSCGRETVTAESAAITVTFITRWAGPGWAGSPLPPRLPVLPSSRAFSQKCARLDACLVDLFWRLCRRPQPEAGPEPPAVDQSCLIKAEPQQTDGLDVSPEGNTSINPS